MRDIREFIGRIRIRGFFAEEQARLRLELNEHVLDLIEQYEIEGSEDAERRALARMGDPAAISRAFTVAAWRGRCKRLARGAIVAMFAVCALLFFCACMAAFVPDLRLQHLSFAAMASSCAPAGLFRRHPKLVRHASAGRLLAVIRGALVSCGIFFVCAAQLSSDGAKVFALSGLIITGAIMAVATFLVIALHPRTDERLLVERSGG